MSAIWRWFTSLSPTSRLALGGGLIAYGLAGPYITDKAGEAFGISPTDEDKQKLKGMIPRISVVDKEETKLGQDKDVEAQMAELRKSR